MRLEVTGLGVRQGTNTVLAGVDLAATAGEVVGLVGANGAGKSTLLSTLAGLLRPARGAIRLEGVRVEGRAPQHLVRSGVSLVPQGRRVFPRLSVRRNLELGGFVAPPGALAARMAAFLNRYPALGDRLELPAGALSGGEQGLVVLGRALMAGPRLLLLDEPLMGLAPALAETVLGHVRELAAGGTTVLVVEHDRDALESVAVRVLRLADGRLHDGSQVSEGTRSAG